MFNVSTFEISIAGISPLGLELFNSYFLSQEIIFNTTV